MEKPNKAIKAKLPVNDTGIVINGMMDARSVRKKKKITKDIYIICNGFKTRQYTRNIARLINEGFKNVCLGLAQIYKSQDPERSLNYYLTGLRKTTGNKNKIVSEETKIKISNSLKERYKNVEHPRKGKKSWCSGTRGTGLVKAWNKNKPAEKTPCPHCNKMIDHMNMKKWHGEKCKQKGR